MGWKPIETAPCDGTKFLAVDIFGLMFVVYGTEDGFFLAWNDDDAQLGGTSPITHWQPLPSQPNR